MSDDELSVIVISELISRRDSNELQQFHAAKAFNNFVTGFLKELNIEQPFLNYCSLEKVI